MYRGPEVGMRMWKYKQRERGKRTAEVEEMQTPPGGARLESTDKPQSHVAMHRSIEIG